MVSRVVAGTQRKKELKLYLLHVSGLQGKQKIKDIPIAIAVTNFHSVVVPRVKALMHLARDFFQAEKQRYKAEADKQHLLPY